MAHDKDHPFVVETEGMKITVHGTKFNVESFPGSENTFVSLKEGSVSLETKAETRFLHPGEVGTFNKRNGRLQIEKEISSWLSRGQAIRLYLKTGRWMRFALFCPNGIM